MSAIPPNTPLEVGDRVEFESRRLPPCGCLHGVVIDGTDNTVTVATNLGTEVTRPRMNAGVHFCPTEAEVWAEAAKLRKAALAKAVMPHAGFPPSPSGIREYSRRTLR